MQNGSLDTRLSFCVQRTLPSTEQTIASVAKTRQNVAVLVQLAIESGAVHDYIRMCLSETVYALRRGHEAEKANARCAGAFEGGHRRSGAPASRQHGIEQKEIPFRGIAGYLEVVVYRLESIVIAIQADMADACRGHKARDALDHSKPCTQNGNECEFLSADAFSRHSLQRCFDRRFLECELACRLICDECGDLVNKLLEDLGRGRAVTKERELVLYEWMRDNAQRRESRGGVHAVEATNFARMKEYQAVMLRLSRHAHDDEDALTDLLNERIRNGWRPTMMLQDDHRLTGVFERPSDGESKFSTSDDRTQ